MAVFALISDKIEAVDDGSNKTAKTQAFRNDVAGTESLRAFASRRKARCAMSWIALRDKIGGVYHPTGLEMQDRRAANIAVPAPKSSPDPNAFLPQGTLMAEFRYDPAPTRQNLLRFAIRDPWQSSLTLCIDPDGSLNLLQGQAERSTCVRLEAGLLATEETVIATFVWDAPVRKGVLTLRLPDQNHFLMTEIADPIPLCYRDVQMISQPSQQARISQSLRYLAISDAAEPVGPIAAIGPGAAIETPRGFVPISQIRLGQTVSTLNRGEMQVRWVGSQLLPARGRYAPLVMRHPYYGLRHDLLIAPEQRLCLKGSKVEYMFGAEEVAASVLHLADGKAITTAAPRLTQRYFHIVLEEPAVISVSGAAMESMDPGPILNEPALLPYSNLQEVPMELLPRATASPIPVLRGYEAISLAR